MVESPPKRTCLHLPQVGSTVRTRTFFIPSCILAFSIVNHQDHSKVDKAGALSRLLSAEARGCNTRRETLWHSMEGAIHTHHTLGKVLPYGKAVG